MTDDHAREAGLLQHFFQPLDPGQVQVISGLVEQQDVGGLHQRLHDCEPLLPAAGERRGFRAQLDETCAAKRFRETRSRSDSGTAELFNAASTTDRTVSPLLNSDSCST